MKEIELTAEFIEKFKKLKNEENLIQIANEKRLEIPDQAARKYFAKLNPKNGELDDEELDGINGGNVEYGRSISSECKKCGSMRCYAHVKEEKYYYWLATWECKDCGFIESLAF